MKKVFIALAFMAIGFGASAKGVNTKKTAPSVTKVEVSTTSENNKTVDTKAGKGLFRRYQMSFTFYDGCGTKMTVWVSGGHNKTAGDLFGAAYAYAEGQLGSNGCF
jgi:hypothetical protein